MYPGYPLRWWQVDRRGWRWEWLNVVSITLNDKAVLQMRLPPLNKHYKIRPLPRLSPRPKTNPNADRFQYHMREYWKRYTCTCQMRSGDKTRLHQALPPPPSLPQPPHLSVYLTLPDITLHIMRLTATKQVWAVLGMRLGPYCAAVHYLTGPSSHVELVYCLLPLSHLKFDWYNSVD